MSQLSDSQLIVLTAACQRRDRCVFPITTKLKGNAAGNVLKSLLKKDLIKEVRAKSNDDTVWRHDEERGRMTLVAAFAALGIDAAEEATEPKPDAVAAPDAKAASAPKGRRPTKSQGPTQRRAREHQASEVDHNAATREGGHDR